MRKIQKVLLGIFASGVLLAGIGTGIAVVEYSTLNYGGEKTIGEENLVTKTLEYELSESMQEVILTGSYLHRADYVTEMEVDENLPKQVIQYEVTYNEKRIHPFIHSEEFKEHSSDEYNTVSLRLGYEYIGNSFHEFMENKDMILNELKQHTISTYTSNYITKVVIKAHPDTMEMIDEAFF